MQKRLNITTIYVPDYSGVDIVDVHNDGAMSLIYKAPESGSFSNFKKDYKAGKLFLRQKMKYSCKIFELKMHYKSFCHMIIDIAETVLYNNNGLHL